MADAVFLHRRLGWFYWGLAGLILISKSLQGVGPGGHRPCRPGFSGSSAIAGLLRRWVALLASLRHGHALCPHRSRSLAGASALDTVHVSLCVHLSNSRCVSECRYVCIRACHICICVPIEIWLNVYTLVYICIRVHICTCVCVHIYIYTYI